MTTNATVRAGGFSLIFGAIAFMAVFSFLAAKFNYPAVLDGPASSVFPALLGMGSTGRTVWAIYGFLPLIWIPAGVGAYRAFRNTHPGAMLLALQCSMVSAIAMMLGLLRWPTIHWRMAQLYAEADGPMRSTLTAIFDGLNVYLGNYIGEFLGEFAFSAFFVLTGWALLKSRATASWIAWIGIATGLLGWIGMFRNVTAVVAPVSAINNYLLPIWMIWLGVLMMRMRTEA